MGKMHSHWESREGAGPLASPGRPAMEKARWSVYVLRPKSQGHLKCLPVMGTELAKQMSLSPYDP